MVQHQDPNKPENKAEIVVAVGPDGGFTPERLDVAATAGFQPAPLG